MLSSTRVVAIKHHHLQPSVDLSMYLLAVMTCVIALPLDEILKVVVPHAAIQNLLNLILLSTVDDRGWWWRVMSVRATLTVLMNNFSLNI
jgi:hypothetical protein